RGCQRSRPLHVELLRSLIVDATSVRIDHTVGPKITVFGRYNHAPSNISPRTGPGFYSINTIAPTDNKTQTLTSGATWVLAPNIVNDLRANWSRSRGAQALVRGCDRARAIRHAGRCDTESGYRFWIVPLSTGCRSGCAALP